MLKTARRLSMSTPLVFLVLLVGCAQEKESLYEHEHFQPEHWPESILEAADFIETRAVSIASGGGDEKERSQLHEELEDLVGWAPEIAADTDLSEADWLPIYELSEAMRGHLSAGDNLAEHQSDFERLVELLRDAQAKIPPPSSEDPALLQDQI